MRYNDISMNMRGKNFREALQLTILAFSWSDWIKPQITSTKSDRDGVKMWAR
jgi:hypothetical protein